MEFTQFVLKAQNEGAEGIVLGLPGNVAGQILDAMDSLNSQLKVAGSEQSFLLGEDANASTQEGRSAFRRLREALERGEKVVSVTGRVEGWKGNLTQFSKKLPATNSIRPSTIVHSTRA